MEVPTSYKTKTTLLFFYFLEVIYASIVCIHNFIHIPHVWEADPGPGGIVGLIKEREREQGGNTIRVQC